MITFTVRCDHPGCTEQGPEGETKGDAVGRALAAGWQRWRHPQLDLCPDHHQPPLVRPVSAGQATDSDDG
jgi:hypothetical protein